MPPAPIFFWISYLPIFLIAVAPLPDGRSGGLRGDCGGPGDPLGEPITHLARADWNLESIASPTVRGAPIAARTQELATAPAQSAFFNELQIRPAFPKTSLISHYS